MRPTPGMVDKTTLTIPSTSAATAEPLPARTVLAGEPTPALSEPTRCGEGSDPAATGEPAGSSAWNSAHAWRQPMSERGNRWTGSPGVVVSQIP